MSKILVSGCGMTFQGTRPTWTKVLKLCGAQIDDHSGPAISNTLILNTLIKKIIKNDYSHVICQLTALGKLDVDVSTYPSRKDIVAQDPVRNFTHKGFWPSSVSKHHFCKQIYYDFLYSKNLDIEDTLLKLLHLQSICRRKNAQLLIVQGYQIDWSDHELLSLIELDSTYSIKQEYQSSKYYQYHDHSNGNTVPNKQWAVYFAKKINETFLMLPIEEKLQKFDKI